MELLLSPEAWLAFVTLAALEIVLGIDNIIFISILVGRLPRARQARARFVGLSLAMVMRIALLLSLVWIMRLTAPLFEIFTVAISGRDLILIGGGLFLLAKSTAEIHDSLEGEEQTRGKPTRAGFGMLMIQIAVIDIVFSLDSVITAVGMARDIEVMVAAIVVAVLVMMAAAGPIGRFVERHPTVKMLALSFLILIGVALIADGLGAHIPKGYIYFAMAFSFGVEMLNLRLRRRAPRAVRLHRRGPR
ncbi:MAG TPA: TerC family protein [Burkholderiales bacterium]|nr:TerC family protein [Burkholderiales bacterium]